MLTDGVIFICVYIESDVYFGGGDGIGAPGVDQGPGGGGIGGAHWGPSLGSLVPPDPVLDPVSGGVEDTWFDSESLEGVVL